MDHIFPAEICYRLSFAAPSFTWNCLYFLKTDVIWHSKLCTTHNVWRWTSVDVGIIVNARHYVDFMIRKSIVSDLLIHPLCCWNRVVKIVYFSLFWNHMTRLVESTRQVQRCLLLNRPVQRCLLLNRPVLYNAPGLRHYAVNVFVRWTRVHASDVLNPSHCVDTFRQPNNHHLSLTPISVMLNFLQSTSHAWIIAHAIHKGRGVLMCLLLRVSDIFNPPPPVYFLF